MASSSARTWSPPDGVPGAVGRTLVKAMERPLAGPPHRPARLRVGDASLAREVREATGDRIPVQIAPTPELGALLALLTGDLPPGDDEDASFLADGRVPASKAAELFEAAGFLHTVRRETHALDPASWIG